MDVKNEMVIIPNRSHRMERDGCIFLTSVILVASPSAVGNALSQCMSGNVSCVRAIITIINNNGSLLDRNLAMCASLSSKLQIAWNLAFFVKSFNRKECV